MEDIMTLLSFLFSLAVIAFCIWLLYISIKATNAIRESARQHRLANHINLFHIGDWVKADIANFSNNRSGKDTITFQIGKLYIDEDTPNRTLHVVSKEKFDWADNKYIDIPAVYLIKIDSPTEDNDENKKCLIKLCYTPIKEGYDDIDDFDVKAGYTLNSLHKRI